VAGLAVISEPGGTIVRSAEPRPGSPPAFPGRPMFDDKTVLAEVPASDEVDDGQAGDVLAGPRPPFEAAVVREHFPPPPGEPASSTGFSLLFVAILLAAFERDTWRPVELSGIWRTIGTRLPLFADISRRSARADKRTGQLPIGKAAASGSI
jgi:hypothetical protein